MVDGCTPAQAFGKMIMPLAAPGVFTTAIITFIAAWNDYMIALSLGHDRVTTAIVACRSSPEPMAVTTVGHHMAAGVIVTVPLVIAVLIFQRRIVAGLTAGGVK